MPQRDRQTDRRISRAGARYKHGRPQAWARGALAPWKSEVYIFV